MQDRIEQAIKVLTPTQKMGIPTNTVLDAQTANEVIDLLKSMQLGIDNGKKFAEHQEKMLADANHKAVQLKEEKELLTEENKVLWQVVGFCSLRIQKEAGAEVAE